MSPNSNNKNKDKKINHLADRVDKQANKGKVLPRHLINQFEMLQQYTRAVRAILATDLPEEMLKSCWVVNVSDYDLTLSVGSVTLSNHLHYMSRQYIYRFQNEDTLLHHVNNIKIIVTYPNKNNIATQ